MLLGGGEDKTVWHRCWSLRKNIAFDSRANDQEDPCDVLISPICPAEHGVAVADHGGHPVRTGAVLSWPETERFHLQANQVSQWISPRDVVLHCLPDFRALPSGWLGHGSCWALDGCCPSRYMWLGSFNREGWVTLSICAGLFLMCIVLAASQPSRLVLC